VVEAVLHNQALLGELIASVLDGGVTVRMRAADALEKVFRARPDWLDPYTPVLLGEIATIDQPSVMWHLAQMLSVVTRTPAERHDATRILKHNLDSSRDWIVTNMTLAALAELAPRDTVLGAELATLVSPYPHDRHTSVARRATKLLATVEPTSRTE
jgi:hypothetical protein